MSRAINRACASLTMTIVTLALTGGSCPAAERELEEWLGHTECSGCLAGKLEASAHWESKAFDEGSGRDLRNFPRDRKVDYLHMKLDMRFEDLSDMRFSAIETLRIAADGKAVNSIKLDAVGLKVNAMMLDGEPVEHFVDDESITVRFDPPLTPGAEHELTLDYDCVEPYSGMYFTPGHPDAPHYTPEVHTQGQTITNRHWFAAHDSPNERMTTELVVDVPSEYSVSSNGKLVSKTASGDRAIWHYLQDKPHVSYLVSLVIGKFDIVTLEHPRVPMDVWVPEGLGDLVEGCYGRTGEMIDVFEDRFGIAYPWDRYDQLVVKNFGAGGMENTSATTMYPTAILDEVALKDRDMDGLISHELAHQWTGDMITCKSWAHIWLNEGWATYGSALWYEHRDGEDGYLDSMRRSFGVARRDKTTEQIPMVSPVWEGPWETFRRRANPYPKGSSILHMLRMMLGEDAFWKGVHLYMNRHALGLAETNDLRYAMEEVSGMGLEWFFEQWCYRPGTPELGVQVEYDGAQRSLNISIEQKQQIDERTPAFRFTLPVYVRTPSGEQTFFIEVDEKTTTHQQALSGTPDIVAIDPHLHVLKTMEVTKPRGMWLAQAAGGPTIVARNAAVRRVGDVDDAESIKLLVGIVRDTSIRHTLRIVAADTLADLASPEAREALLSMLRESIADPRVRATLVDALRKFDKDEVTDLLADIARTDESYAIRVNAIQALAHHEAKDHADLLVELLEFESQHDQVRNAALRAITKLEDDRGLELAIKYSAYGYMDRARPVAVRQIGELVDQDRDRAIKHLLALLDDPERRTVQAAAGALAATGDERAEEPLRALSESHPSPRFREQAKRNLETLREKVKKKEG